jgi:phospholipid/cholesterol/gamma-HCH transport system permease protein
MVTELFEFIGNVSLFGLRAIVDFFRPPREWSQIGRQIIEVGHRSLPLVIASGLALGTVLTLHTRSSLVSFGASAEIPTVQSLAFFIEVGPLATALLLAGRAGSGIGAVLANMRVTEQIDGLESLSIDSFKFLVVPRVVACVIALPILTLFMDFSGITSGFLSEYMSSKISLHLYISRAFSDVDWSNFIPPVMKTTVFGFIIGTVSSFLGYTTNEGAEGVGRAATRSVVASSLLIILADIVLIKLILFAFPDNAL